MATENAKRGIGTKLAVKLGEGTCNIINSFRTLSDDYKNYYDNKEHKSLVDVAFNVVNEVVRFIPELTTEVHKEFKSASDEMELGKGIKNLKSGIANMYNKARDNYNTYLNKTAAQIDADKLNPNKSKFATGFKSFINSTLQTIDNAYKGGEKFVKSAYKSISEGVKTITADVKESSAYKELMRKDAAQTAAENENAADKGKDDVEPEKA